MAATRQKAKPGTEQKRQILTLISQFKEERFGEAHVTRCREKFTDLSDEEFVGIMRKAWELGADPLNGELYFRRQTGGGGTTRISVMASIAAMRAYAERQGDYAGDKLPLAFIYEPEYRPGPGEEASYIVFSDRLKDSTNPLGIVSCTVGVYRWVQGEFRRHSATVAWADYVPLQGHQISSAAWKDIPVVMISKVAEVAALRRAYPALGAIYVEEEMTKFQHQGIEVGPSVAVAPSQVRDVPRKAVQPAAKVVLAGPEAEEVVEPEKPIRTACLTIGVNFGDGEGLVEVREDEFFKTVATFLQDKLDAKNPQAVLRWFDENTRARTDFYTYDQQRGGEFVKRLRNLQRIANERVVKARGRRGSGPSLATVNGSPAR